MIPRDRLTGWLWRKGRGVDPWIRHAPAAAAKCQDAPCAKMSLRNKAVYGADGSIPGSHQGRDARSGTVLLCAGCTAWRTSSQFIHIEPDETDTLARVPAAARPNYKKVTDRPDSAHAVPGRPDSWL